MTLNFYGQHLQDKYLEETIFRGFTGGYFVDVGAHDGVNINNTYFFEKERQWKGILIEPLPCVYQRLVENRPNGIPLNVAVDDVDGTTEFIMNTGYTEMLSGISKHYEPEHYKRLQAELASQGGNSNVINVQTRRLESIFDEHGVKHVHLLSVDVEGAELQVMQSINFEKVFIDVILFEANYAEKGQAIVDYLTGKGYAFVHFNGLDICMVHKDSTFTLK